MMRWRTIGVAFDTDIRDSAECPPSFTPWIDADRIRASCARDVLERVLDDRTFWRRSEQGSCSLAAARLSRSAKFNFGAKAKRVARPKVERTDEVRAYFREYQRRRRAEAKAETMPTA